MTLEEVKDNFVFLRLKLRNVKLRDNGEYTLILAGNVGHYSVMVETHLQELGNIEEEYRLDELKDIISIQASNINNVDEYGRLSNKGFPTVNWFKK